MTDRITTRHATADEHLLFEAVNRPLGNRVVGLNGLGHPSAQNGSPIDLSGLVWPQPAPLPSELPEVQPFDAELLPEAFRPWMQDVSDRVQCPPDFPAVACMVALGSVIGRRVALYPKRFDTWHEFPNLWGAIVGKPGVLKSPALNEALRALRHLESAAAESNLQDVTSWELRQAELAVMRDASKAKAREAAKKGLEFDVSGFASTQQDEPPALRRYVVNDASVEALGEVLRGNQNGTLVYQDELISLLKLLDREGNEAARGFYLTAWNAKEPYTFDRIGRGLNRRVEAVCLSLLGSIQPSVVGEYLRDATAGGGGDGLMARFSLMVWPDIAGEWRNVDRFPDSEAWEAARSVFIRCDGLDSESINATASAGAPGLRFDDKAQSEFDAWREDFERAQRTSEDHAALVAHREKYRKLVPAIALISHLADNPNGGPVGVGALLRGIAWAEYAESHAKRAYASVMRAEAEAARELLKRIRRRDVATDFRTRDVYRHGWSRLSDAERVRTAARMLVDFDYLREMPDSSSVQGGRPTFRYIVNPKALS